MAASNRREFLAGGVAAGIGLAIAGASKSVRARAGAQAAPIKSAGIRLITVDGKYKVWTKKVGAGAIKLLTLHGGPGCTHEYFECFEDFLPQAGIEFYYYDQLGSFYSDQPDDLKLWNIERFRDEVEQVRVALGLENFYLFGHSWGGMLAIEYALKYQRHLKALAISSMAASIPAYVKYINELRRQLSPAEIRILEKYEAKGDYEAPEYHDLVFKRIYAKHLCRVVPWPDPVERTFKHINPKVYNTMQGPNEFVVTGTFKDWDRWRELPDITVPTWLTVGRYDTMSPDDLKRMAKLIPHSRFDLSPNGSHLAMWDDQEVYFRNMIRFLHDVEAGRFRG